MAVSYGDAFCLLLLAMLVGVTESCSKCAVLSCFQLMGTHLKYLLMLRLPQQPEERLQIEMHHARLLPSWSQALTTHSEKPLNLNYGFIVHLIKKPHNIKHLRAAAVVEVPHVPLGWAL